MIKTDFKGVFNSLERINRKMSKMEDIATTRTLNIILEKERREIANDVSEEYGVLKGSAKSHIKPIKATRNNKNIKLIAESGRSNLVQPKKIKGGISFRKKGGSRAKIKVAVTPGSSKPFMIKAKAGGQAGGEDIQVKGTKKLVPVYVPPEYNKKTNIWERKVKTLKGSSLKRMIQELGIKNESLKKSVLEKFPSIYKIQLDKAKYTGGGM